jgi:hypothetical protein
LSEVVCIAPQYCMHDWLLKEVYNQWLGACAHDLVTCLHVALSKLARLLKPHRMWLGSGPTTQSAAASLKDRPASYRCYEEFQRNRAKQLKTASQRRLQSTAVDFRRVWWDKDARYPSKTGLSFWRPIPPQGYISLGDSTGPTDSSSPFQSRHTSSHRLLGFSAVVLVLQPCIPLGMACDRGYCLKTRDTRLKRRLDWDAGDCAEVGYDPPQSIVVLLDSELAEMEHTSTPLVRPPRGFELLWHDESDRADRCLSIWRPVPFPG